MNRTPCRLRSFGYLCLWLSALLALTMTFGFTSASADRTASVEVVTDENALLGVTDNSDLITQTLSGTEEALFFVDDNIGVYDTSTADDIGATLETFDGNESTALRADARVRNDTDYDWQILLECGSEDRDLTGTATITIETFGSVSAELTRTTQEEVEVNCSN